MPGCPVTGRVVAVGEVESRRQRPCPRLIHQKSDVFHVVVLITPDDVEYHPPKHLFDGAHAQSQLADHEQSLLVGISASLVIVEMRQCPE